MNTALLSLQNLEGEDLFKTSMVIKNRLSMAWQQVYHQWKK